MSTLTKLVAALIVTLAIGGAYFFPQTSIAPVGSSAGTSFSTAKVAQININPQSITSTSTSLLNSDASDRYVTDAFVACTGLTNMFAADAVGVATLNWTAATSSVAAPVPSIATRSFAALQVTVGTSTAFNQVATSTYTVPWGRIWTAGTYMVFQTNATSSAAACTVGVHYLAS